MAKNRVIVGVLALLLLLSLPACQTDVSSLQTKELPGGVINNETVDPEITQSAAASDPFGFSAGEIYPMPSSAEELCALCNESIPVFITDLAFYQINKDSFYMKPYFAALEQGPVSWRSRPYNSCVLTDGEMTEVGKLTQQFVFCVDDMQTPGFIESAGSGQWRAGSYTPQQADEMQKSWRQQIMTQVLYQGLLDSGRQISWIPSFLENDIAWTYVYILVAEGNVVYEAASSEGSLTYAVPVMLCSTGYTDLKSDNNFMTGGFKEYMALYPERRTLAGNLGNVFHWLFMKYSADGDLIITGWETNVIHNGVADGIIYDETGVYTAWFDRTDGLLNGYEMTVLEHSSEQDLTRRLYDRGVEFITAMYTLKGADMADEDFNAAQSLMAPELRDAPGQAAFFAEYLQNIREQDIRMTPYFNEDPFDESLGLGVDTNITPPLAGLARLTKPGAPDLYPIIFHWNYRDFSSNVERIPAVDPWMPIDTLDLSGHQKSQDVGWESIVSRGNGLLAIVTFVERDGQWQVINWQTRGA